MSFADVKDGHFVLLDHAVHDVGTRFSHFGYCGESAEYLQGGGNLSRGSGETCVIVLENQDTGSEPESTQCTVKLLPMRNSMLDIAITFQADGRQVAYSFFLDVSGGIKNQETRWVNLLRNWMRIAVLQTPDRESAGYRVEIDDGDDSARRVLTGAVSQLPYEAWQGTGRVTLIG